LLPTREGGPRALGDRIAVLNHGKVRQVGTPQEIYGNPTDTFVATFIGSPPMNLIEDGKIYLGFRPEAFLPMEVEPVGDNVTFPFRITRIEYRGATALRPRCDRSPPRGTAHHLKTPD